MNTHSLHNLEPIHTHDLKTDLFRPFHWLKSGYQDFSYHPTASYAHGGIVADSSQARVFKTDSPSSPLCEIRAMAHPEARMHEQNMTSDLHGKDSGQGTGAGGHAYQEKVAPKQQEVIKFAKRTADYLNKVRLAHKLEQSN